MLTSPLSASELSSFSLLVATDVLVFWETCMHTLSIELDIDELWLLEGLFDCVPD